MTLGSDKTKTSEEVAPPSTPTPLSPRGSGSFSSSHVTFEVIDESTTTSSSSLSGRTLMTSGAAEPLTPEEKAIIEKLRDQVTPTLEGFLFGDPRQDERLRKQSLRRKSLIIWLLVLYFHFCWTGFIDLLLRLLEVKVSLVEGAGPLVKRWFEPLVWFEIFAVGILLITVYVKMLHLQNRWIRRSFNVIMLGTVVQLLVAAVAVPVVSKVYLEGMLSEGMIKMLKHDLKGPVGPEGHLLGGNYWNGTQEGFKCCGYFNRWDWMRGAAEKEEVFHRKVGPFKNGTLRVGGGRFLAYPRSCCKIPGGGVGAEGEGRSGGAFACTEFSGGLWTQGCFDKEKALLWEYTWIIFALASVSLVLTFLIRRRVHHYAKVMVAFRPQEVEQ